MKLLSLRVKNFRGITKQEVTFDDGVTIVSGHNEIGKSSLIDAFDYLLKFKDNSNSQIIRSCQPVGRDVGPEVEATFRIGPEVVTYRKRWISARETVLSFVEGPRRGTTLKAGQAHEAAEELWSNLDTHLWEASRLMQGSALSRSPLSASTALQRALDEQAGGTSEDGTSGPLMERVTAEANRYYTPTRNDGKILVDAGKRVTAAEEKLANAQAEKDKLTALIDELASLEADAADRKANLEDQEATLAELAEQAEKAQALQSAREDAQKLVESIERDVADASEKVARREHLAEAVTTAEEALTELSGTEKTQSEALAPLVASLTDTQDKIAGLKSDLAAVKKALESAREFERRSTARLELDRVTTLLSDYDTLSTDIAELEGALVPASSESLERVVDLERDIALAEAAASAGAARIRITSLGAPTIVLDGEETALGDDGLDRAVLEELTVEIPGTVSMTVVPDQDADSNSRELERMRAELSQALAAEGATSVADLKTAVTAYEEGTAKLSRLRERRTDKLQGSSAEQLRDNLVRLKAVLSKPEEAVEGDIDALTERHESLEAEIATVDEILSDQQNRISSLRTELAATTGQVMNQRLAVTRAQAELETERAAATDEALGESLKAATMRLTEAKDKVESLEAELVRSGGHALITDYELHKKHVEGLRSLLSEKTSDVRVKRHVLETLQRDAIQLAFDRALSEVEYATAERDSLQSRALAAKLLEDVLKKHKSETQRKYIEPFRGALQKLGRLTYQNPTFDVEIADDLSVSGRFLDGDLIPFDDLSTGAREQMSILIRLATASLVSPDDAVPVLLDDTLGYSDRLKLHRVIDAIGSLKTASQIIIFTANEDRFAGLSRARRVSL